MTSNGRTDRETDPCKPLGQLLLDDGALSEAQLGEALTAQARGEAPEAQRLGEILCRLGHVDAQTVREALVRQARVPRVSFDNCTIDPQAVAMVPAEVAFRHKVLPISTHDATLSVAMGDPFDRQTVDLLRALTGMQIRRLYCPESELLEALAVE